MMLRAASPPQLHRFTLRTVAFVMMALTLIGSLSIRDTPPAAANAGDEVAFVAALNNVRANAGLPPLTVNVQLANLSRGHAQVMADAGQIFHASPISAGYSGPWSKIGENVGSGATVSNLVNAFVASSGHYANIVDPAFTEIGVGVVWVGPKLYTTHRFLQVSGTTTTTTTQPPASTTMTAQPPVTTTTSPAVPQPTTTTTAPIPQPTTTTTAPILLRPAALAPTDVDASRIVTLLEMLERVGT